MRNHIACNCRLSNLSRIRRNNLATQLRSNLALGGRKPPALSPISTLPGSSRVPKAGRDAQSKRRANSAPACVHSRRADDFQACFSSKPSTAITLCWSTPRLAMTHTAYAQAVCFPNANAACLSAERRHSDEVGSRICPHA